jgi:glycosyltransferase involved in cell wall biosynthesis
MNSLKDEGHQIVVLTNEGINNDRILRIFGERAKVDREIVFPFELFPATDLHNVYTDAVRTLLLKSKCDVLIDTHSNAILPGVDITYIHFPLLGRLKTSNVSGLRAKYYSPYLSYEKRTAKSPRRLILANSRYTANAIRNTVGVNPNLLYPPISETFYADRHDTHHREDLVVSVSRISPGKNLTMIPSIARVTDSKIHFLIVGIKQSSEELDKILRQIEVNKVSDRVEVLTNVSREGLLKILKRAKIFLHVAHGEHFGVSIAEAMASGCIPIVHNSGGPVEFVPASFRFGGLEEAAGKIGKAISEWSPQQSRMFTTVAEMFSEEHFSREFLNAFSSYVRCFVHN